MTRRTCSWMLVLVAVLAPTAIEAQSAPQSFADLSGRLKAGDTVYVIAAGREARGDVVGTEHDWEAAGLRRRGDQVVERPRLLERDRIEEAPGTDGDAELGATWRSSTK